MGIREHGLLLGIAVLLLAVLWPIARIRSRAGFSPWFSLIILLPIVNVIAPWFFAYAKWPALERPADGDSLRHESR
jgi:hypothetical protein